MSFNLNVRVVSDLHIIITILEYSEFDYIIIFTSDF